MARKDPVEALIEQMAPDVAAAFIDSISNITSDVQIASLIKAIESGDLAGALRVINLGSEYFLPLDRAIRGAYEAGGDAIMAGFVSESARQGAKVTARFDSRNQLAEQFLKTESAQMIVDISDPQRVQVTNALVSGMEQSKAPRSVALDIVGRIDKITGVRTGGIVGLTQGDIDLSNEVYRILTEEPRKYFIIDRKTGEWKPRYKGTDRRFDRTVAAAIRNGETISANDAGKIVGKYRNRLLLGRGDTIARTELLGTINAAQDHSLEQLIDNRSIMRRDIQNEWDASNDGATRDSHAFMDGQIREQGKAYETGAGFLMLHPGDRSLGAPAEEIINCRCRKIVRIDFLAQLARKR